MMRVLIANPSVGLGGAEFHTIELARHLSQCGAEVMHALERTRENESLFRTANNGISSLPLAWHRTAFPQEEALRQSRVLRKAVSSYSPDLLIIPLAYPDAAPGLLACAADLGLPTVVIFHLARKTINLTDLQLRAYARALQSANIHWVAVSPWLADTMSFLTGIPRSRITVIRNGAFQSDREVADLSDRDAVRAAVLDEFGIDPRDKVILTVARIDTQKNHLDLVTAADAVVRLRPDVKFVWLGEGPSTAIVDERIRELRLSPYIMRLGHRSDAERFYKAADLFVLPTLVEGDSLSLAEAAFHGIPIVTTNASGQDESYPHEQAALIVNVSDSQALGEAVLRLIRNPTLAKQLSIGARKLAADRSKKKMLARYSSLFQAALQSKTTPRSKQCPIWLVVEDLEDVLYFDSNRGSSFDGGWLVSQAMAVYLKENTPAQARFLIFDAGCLGKVLSSHVLGSRPIVVAKASCGLENVKAWNDERTGAGAIEVSSSAHPDILKIAKEPLAALTQLADTLHYGAAWYFDEAGSIPAQAMDWPDFNRLLFMRTETDLHVTPRYMRLADGGFQTPLRDLYLTDESGISRLALLDGTKRIEVMRALLPRPPISGGHEIMLRLAKVMESAPAPILRDFVQVGLEHWKSDTNYRVPIANLLLNLISASNPMDEESELLLRQVQLELDVAKFDMVQHMMHRKGSSAIWRGGKRTALYFFRRIPYPIKSGSDARVVSTLRLLQSLGFRCLFATYCKPNEVNAVRQSAERFRLSFGIEVDVHVLTSSEADNLTRLDSATSWDTFMMKSLHRHVHRLSEMLNPDLVFINFPHYAYLSICGAAQSAVTVIDGHDIVSSRSHMSTLISRLAGKDERKIISEPSDRLFDTNEYIYDGGFDDSMEIELYDQFSIALAISPKDQDYLSTRLQQAKVCFAPIICGEITPIGTSDGLPLFSGSVNQLNAIAASYIVNDLIPKMRSLYPDFQVRFVGGICALLPDMPGVVKEGVVQEMRQIYQNTSFVLAPLFWGSGQNVKVIEALGFGVPSITFTEIAGRCGLSAAEAMIARDGWEFFEATRELHRDPEKVRKLGHGCIKLAMQEHSITAIKRRLQDSIMSVI